MNNSNPLASFPVGMLDPRVGIFLSPLNTSDGFYFSHYENTPMQYIEIVFGSKNENFHWKNFDIFLTFAQNIDCGYTLEPPR